MAGSLALQATASPIRVVVVTSSQEIAAPIPLAPVAHFRPNVEMMAATTMIQNGPGAGRPHGPCGGMKAKGLMMANKFRQIFGLPPIEPFHPDRPAFKIMNETDLSNKPAEDHDAVRIMPFIGTPPARPTEERMRGRPHFHHHFHHQKDSFLERVHQALMSLGPWEGRAVAFVLGCGLGVLLRMIWVMTVLTYRVVRGRNNTEEEDYYYEVPTSVEYVVFDRDAEEILVPPPQYNDEKVALAEESPVKAPETETTNAN